MGFSVAGAAAIVLVALAVAGFRLTGAWLDADQSLREAMADAAQRDAQSVHAAIAVQDVNTSGPVVVTVLNTGSATLDASHVDVLADGIPRTVDVRQVDGASHDVWPPGSTLTLTLAGGVPGRIVVDTDVGALAYWRS